MLPQSVPSPSFCAEKHPSMIEVIKSPTTPNPRRGRNSDPKPNLNKTGNRHKRLLEVKKKRWFTFVALSKLSVNLITRISKQKSVNWGSISENKGTLELSREKLSSRRSKRDRKRGRWSLHESYSPRSAAREKYFQMTSLVWLRTQSKNSTTYTLTSVITPNRCYFLFFCSHYGFTFVIPLGLYWMLLFHVSHISPLDKLLLLVLFLLTYT